MSLIWEMILLVQLHVQHYLDISYSRKKLREDRKASSYCVVDLSCSRFHGHTGLPLTLRERTKMKKKVKLLHVLLIPKKAGTLEVNNYWSISLVGSIYKILIKSIGKYIEGDIGRDCVNHRIHLFKADKYLTLFL